MAPIQPQYHSLGALLQGRLFRIPDYQRAYSWETTQRKDLFDDINKLVDKNSERHHFMAAVVCLLKNEKEEVGTDEFGVYDVVDGQQRLTTLVILFKALEKILAKPADNDAQKMDKVDAANELNKILLKGNDNRLILLQTNHESQIIFRKYIEDGKIPDKHKVVTLAEKNLVNAFTECESFVKEWETDKDKKKGALKLFKILKNRLDFIFYTLDDEGAVYTVFEVLNSRGLDVDWLDKSKSLLMSIPFEKLSQPIRDETTKMLHAHWGKIYQIIGVREVPGDEILRFSATLMCEDPQSKIFSAEKATEYFREYCQKLPQSVVNISSWFIDVAQKLKELYKNPRRKAVTEISQARLLAVAIMLNSSFSEAEKDLLLNEWEKVTFRVYGMSGNDARKKVGDYTRLAHKIYRVELGESVDKIRKQIRELGSDCSIENALEQVKNRDCYNGWEVELRYFMYCYEKHLASLAGVNINLDRWSEIWDDSPSTTIEHIHPQVSNSYNLPQHWKGKIPGNKEFIEKQTHRLGNLMLLPPDINLSAGNRPFDEKKIEYKKHYLHFMDEILAVDDWNIESINEREIKLLKWARENWN